MRAKYLKKGDKILRFGCYWTIEQILYHGKSYYPFFEVKCSGLQPGVIISHMCFRRTETVTLYK